MATYHSIPTGSAILMAKLDTEDVRQAHMWASSMTEFVANEGCGMEKPGPGPYDFGTANERIPRHI